MITHFLTCGSVDDAQTQEIGGEYCVIIWFLSQMSKGFRDIKGIFAQISMESSMHMFWNVSRLDQRTDSRLKIEINFKDQNWY